MASDKLQKILAMSKNIDKKGSKSKQTTPQKVFKTPMSIHEQTNKANQAIADIDAMYTAPYVPTKEEKEAWNTERGREELTEMADKNVFMQKTKIKVNYLQLSWKVCDRTLAIMTHQL